MKINKLYLSISAFALVSATSLNAQVKSQKIGDNPTIINPSAVLDVESTNKGVLLPRIALSGTADATTIAAPTTSMLVYNTATAGTAPNDVMPGYYFWNGAAWTRLATGASATDNQTLNIAGNTLSISNGNTVTLPTATEVDGSVTNELQTISLLGNDLSLSNGGGTVTIPSSADGDAWGVDGENQTSAVTRTGNVGIGVVPTTSLDVFKSTAGAVKIVDGTQAVNKVLISDAVGVGTWQKVTENSINSGAAAANMVLTADGAGGATWAAASGSSGGGTALAPGGSNGAFLIASNLPQANSVLGIWYQILAASCIAPSNSLTAATAPATLTTMKLSSYNSGVTVTATKGITYSFGGHSYAHYSVNSNVNYFQAEKIANELGGYLMVPNSLAEFNTVVATNSGNQMWIAGILQQPEMLAYWSPSGEPRIATYIDGGTWGTEKNSSDAVITFSVNKIGMSYVNNNGESASEYALTRFVVEFNQ